MAEVPRHHLDLNQPAFIFNPYPQLAELREQRPVFYDEAWQKLFFARYDDIAALLRDKRLGRSILHVLSRDELGWPPLNPDEAPFHAFNSTHLLDREPPDHTRLRALVSKAFTPQRAEGLRGRIEQVVNGLIDRVQAQGRMDVMRDYAEPLPVAVIAELLGVPEPHRAKLRPWSAAIVKMYELGYTEEQAQAASQAVLDFSALLRALADARRAQPQDDLITALVQVEEQGDRLTEDELIANCILLLNAGHEATVNGTTAGLLALFRNPAQKEWLTRQAVEGNTAAFRPAVEELLRYDTPLPMFERWVLEDLDYHGVALKRGMEVGLLYASGNRDPRRFERADELDLTRKDNAHLTFGLGIHYCLGAPLARLEMQISLQTLLRRLPAVRLAIPDEAVPYGPGFVIRGIRSLPVEW
jgi:unspecific monooxygenase